jgi:uncharacterized protein (DUF1684 family)
MAAPAGRRPNRTGGEWTTVRSRVRVDETWSVDELDLLDWKRRIFALYAAVRAAADPEDAWRTWRSVRDGLFRDHPQSPLPAERRAAFAGLPVFDHDPALRTLGEVDPVDGERVAIGSSGDEPVWFRHVATVRFALGGTPLELPLYWLEAYGGGLFLPFADATSGAETYGAGRYLLDTVKGSDLGDEDGRLVLDFNFAYNPSCAYDPRWACPLTPPRNRLPVPIRAGERI